MRQREDVLRNRILKERGLDRSRDPTKKKIIKPVRITANDKLKTIYMRFVESQTGTTIENVLLNWGSLQNIVRELGKFNLTVDYTTISKWKKKLGLNFSSSSLPKCLGCLEHNEQCNLGVCSILFRLEKYELMYAKRMEIFGDIENQENKLG